MIKRISELPIASDLPKADELIVPVFKEPDCIFYRKVSVSSLADLISEEVLKKSSQIELVKTENGIRFIKK